MSDEKVGKLGSGKRFAKLEHELSKGHGAHDPGAIAAYIGRKKYGNKKFQKLAEAGRKRAAK